MNRREALFGAAAAAGVASIGLPAQAASGVRPLGDKVVLVAAFGAEQNPHFGLVQAWAEKAERDGFIECNSDMFTGYLLTLARTTIIVTPGRPVWNCMTGEDGEPGLAIQINESGFDLPETFILATAGSRFPELPPYMVKRPVIDYDRDAYVRKALTQRKLLEYDFRWLQKASAEIKPQRTV